MVSAACDSRAVTNADGRCSYTEMFLHRDVPACPVKRGARWERVTMSITMEGQASAHPPPPQDTREGVLDACGPLVGESLGRRRQLRRQTWVNRET